MDTREQRPLCFSNRVVAVRGTLRAGDYSVEEMEQTVAVERKSLDDLVSSVIHHRARFLRELTRLQSYRAACVVVEADLADVLCHRYRSRAHPNAVLGAVAAIMLDYDVPVVFCSDNQWCARFVETYLVRAYRKERDPCMTPTAS